MNSSSSREPNPNQPSHTFVQIEDDRTSSVRVVSSVSAASKTMSLRFNQPIWMGESRRRQARVSSSASRRPKRPPGQPVAGSRRMISSAVARRTGRGHVRRVRRSRRACAVPSFGQPTRVWMVLIAVTRRRWVLVAAWFPSRNIATVRGRLAARTGQLPRISPRTAASRADAWHRPRQPVGLSALRRSWSLGNRRTVLDCGRAKSRTSRGRDRIQHCSTGNSRTLCEHLFLQVIVIEIA